MGSLLKNLSVMMRLPKCQYRSLCRTVKVLSSRSLCSLLSLNAMMFQSPNLCQHQGKNVAMFLSKYANRLLFRNQNNPVLNRMLMMSSLLDNLGDLRAVSFMDLTTGILLVSKEILLNQNLRQGVM